MDHFLMLFFDYRKKYIDKFNNNLNDLAFAKGNKVESLSLRLPVVILQTLLAGKKPWQLGDSQRHLELLKIKLS